MPDIEPLLVAKGDAELRLLPSLANRHGLIAGATGTGKTVTLRVLAEGFSRIGVPVFLADVKGDLSGLALPGGGDPRVEERARQLGLTSGAGSAASAGSAAGAGFGYEASPVAFWDVFGEQGHPIRATVSEMGPLLLGRLLQLNPTQSGVLSVVFRIADDNGLLLLDLKDLRAMLQHAAENAAQYRTAYGNVSSASVGAIQRALVALEEQGGDRFFGEPALDLNDLLATAAGGSQPGAAGPAGAPPAATARAPIHILAADRLIRSPQVYATFLLWLLSELFERLPEVGDPEKPRLVFVFDEAHLLFADAPKPLQEKIEQVVRLIRSKGVGVYFVTQNPLDVPDAVLGQLGNRVQHALRAFTPRDQKAVTAAATTFRANPKLDVAQAITELGVGEALVSLLEPGGVPGVVQRAWICPPRSRLAPLAPAERAQILAASPLRGRYDQAIDRESAYEVLTARASAAAQAQADTEATETQARADAQARRQQSASARVEGRRGGATGGRAGGGGVQGEDLMEAFAKSAARAVGSRAGRELVRGLLGSLLGGR